MKILITGGAGYFGSELVGYMLRAGHEVVVYDNLIRGNAGLLPYLHRPGYEFRRAQTWPGMAGSLGVELATQPWPDEPERLIAEIKPDAIVHLAAIVGEAACANETSENIRWANIELAALFAELAFNMAPGSIPFLFASTCSNYGVSEYMCSESDHLNPQGLYAKTKVSAENQVLEQGGTVFRFATLCGLAPFMRTDLLLNGGALALASGATFEIFGRDTYRPFVHIADACRAVECWLDLWTVPSLERTEERVFNIVGANYTKQAIAMHMWKVHSGDLFLSGKRGRGDERDYRATGDLAEKELGFVPNHDPLDAFDEMLEFYKLRSHDDMLRESRQERVPPGGPGTTVSSYSAQAFAPVGRPND